MRLIRWTVLGVTLALLGWSIQNPPSQRRGAAFPLKGFFFVEPNNQPMAPHSELDGTWEILSVHRDGVLDPVQVGAKLTFANEEVKFQPNVREFDFMG